jgi:hypothetical protein
MNKNQRNRIQIAQNALSAAMAVIYDWEPDDGPAIAIVDELYNALEDIETLYNDIAEEEQDKFDNLSEGLQQSERGQTYESNASTFETAAQETTSVKDSLEGITVCNETTIEKLKEICDLADELTNIEGE